MTTLSPGQNQALCPFYTFHYKPFVAACIVVNFQKAKSICIDISWRKFVALRYFFLIWKKAAY